MSSLRPIEIVGGGLAGLALGLALRRHGVPVTVHEASTYPRFKVCGEFIAGLDATTVRQLHLEPWLDRHARHRSVSWHHRSRRLGRRYLPEPAIGVSRDTLDTELARALRAAGGELREHSRQETALGGAPGRVLASGRRRERTGWLGLKLHFKDLPLEADLEMHLGAGGYVGLAGVDADRVNVCGLFNPRPPLPGPPETILLRYLRACDLDRLADRLERAVMEPGTQAAIAGVRFGFQGPHDSTTVAIGDAFAAIPPFTGHGMAMALQGAALAVDPLVAWAQGRCDWEATAHRIQRRLRRCFWLRLSAAQALHAWLLAPRRQATLARLQACHLLPFRLLYRALH